jgi:hypothetical protein
MKEYSVKLPVAGYAVVMVEADNEKEALEKALESEVKLDDIEEWDVHEHIIEGNIFYGNCNDPEIDLEYDDSED